VTYENAIPCEFEGRLAVSMCSLIRNISYALDLRTENSLEMCRWFVDLVHCADPCKTFKVFVCVGLT
jgi:hypothetical protein